MLKFLKEFRRERFGSKESVEDSFRFKIDDMTIKVKTVFQDWRLKVYVTIDSPDKFHFEMLKD